MYVFSFEMLFSCLISKADRDIQSSKYFNILYCGSFHLNPQKKNTEAQLLNIIYTLLKAFYL